jgi:hypothetical protein
MQKSLTKTLVFQLDSEENAQQLLDEAFREARRVYTETIRRAKNGDDWETIRQDLESDADLVNNTAQLVVQKSLEAMENYYEYNDCDILPAVNGGVLAPVIQTTSPSHRVR